MWIKDEDSHRRLLHNVGCPLTAAKIPAGFASDGHSLVSFLKGGPAPQRDYFYWELHENKPIQAARFGDWKAVRRGITKPIELYDLSSDIGEQHEVADDHPEIVERIIEIMHSARTESELFPLVRKE